MPLPRTRQSCSIVPMHHWALLRSLVHTGFCHQQGAQQLLTGHPVRELKQKPDDPDLLSITHHLRSDPARTQPGRDHWPSATSLLFSGGGIAAGQVIGATDRRGEQVTERRVGVGDFLATIYRHLGIHAEDVAINNHSGRPVPILQDGQPIPELLSAPPAGV